MNEKSSPQSPAKTPSGRRLRRWVLVPALALLISGLGFGMEQTGVLPGGGTLDAGAATAYTATMSGIEKQKTAYGMLALVNSARSSASSPALAWDAALETAAITRAREAALYFSHTRPTGSLCFTVSSRINAENIYVGYLASATTANNSWMNSSGHRTNRLNSAYKSYAAACFQGRDGATYWVEVFGKTSSVNKTPLGTDTDRNTAGVRVTDTYISLTGSPSDLARKTIGVTDLRADYDYYFTLKTKNLKFDVSYTTFTRGVFTSSNRTVALVDSATGKVYPQRAGLVTITGKLSSYSGKSVSKTLLIRPAKIAGLTAAGRTKSVLLTFTPAPGATGYEIWRADSATGTYTLAGTAGATAKTWTCTGLTSGKTYYFRVRGYFTKTGSTTRYTGLMSDPAACKAL